MDKVNFSLAHKPRLCFQYQVGMLSQPVSQGHSVSSDPDFFGDENPDETGFHAKSDFKFSQPHNRILSPSDWKPRSG